MGTNEPTIIKKAEKRIKKHSLEVANGKTWDSEKIRELLRDTVQKCIRVRINKAMHN
jgi:hypothetical protein